MELKLNVLFSLFFFISNGIDTDRLKLKQVLILSRHNIRTPMGTELEKFSSKPWPKKSAERGLLTKKGVLLEGYMGEYFADWFKSEKLLTEGCPSKDTVFVYANSVNRTIATAEAFVKSAFEDCNVTVHHKRTNGDEMDPTFNPIIRNTTDAFKNYVYKEIYRKLHNLKLKQALSELNEILDVKNSEICKLENICDLTDSSKNNISYEVGSELWVNGPLYIGNTVLDTFAMNFYNGMPLEDIAWGYLTTPEEWEIITEISRVDHDIRYRTVAEDMGAPLINYLTKTFLNYNEMPKIILIVGHDYNLNAVFNSWDFEPIRLPNHYESFPIGGKIVFQRWTDNKYDYLKIEYVYASWAQTRNGTKLSLECPPQRVLLQLNWCSIDKNGFCPWTEFINKLL